MTQEQLVLPVTPSEAQSLHALNIPNFVITSVNNLLIRCYVGRKITILQKDLANEMIANCPERVTESDLLRKGYMDFEDRYREFGWKITYHKPDYTENFDPYFAFSDDSK